MKKYVNKFSVPSWIVLLIGITMDFVLVILGKYQSFPVKISDSVDAVVPAFTSGCAVAFVLINVPRWYREYKSK